MNERYFRFSKVSNLRKVKLILRFGFILNCIRFMSIARCCVWADAKEHIQHSWYLSKININWVQQASRCPLDQISRPTLADADMYTGQSKSGIWQPRCAYQQRLAFWQINIFRQARQICGQSPLHDQFNLLCASALSCMVRMRASRLLMFKTLVLRFGNGVFVLNICL